MPRTKPRRWRWIFALNCLLIQRNSSTWKLFCWANTTRATWRNTRISFEWHQVDSLVQRSVGIRFSWPRRGIHSCHSERWPGAWLCVYRRYWTGRNIRKPLVESDRCQRLWRIPARSEHRYRRLFWLKRITIKKRIRTELQFSHGRSSRLIDGNLINPPSHLSGKPSAHSFQQIIGWTMYQALIRPDVCNHVHHTRRLQLLLIVVQPLSSSRYKEEKINDLRALEMSDASVWMYFLLLERLICLGHSAQASSPTVIGNKHLTHRRSLINSSFSKLFIRGLSNCYVKWSAPPTTIDVHTDSNIQAHVNVRVESDTLKITMPSDMDFKYTQMDIYLQLPSTTLNEIFLAGVTHFEGSNLLSTNNPLVLRVEGITPTDRSRVRAWPSACF